MTGSPSTAVQAVYERLGRVPTWLLAEANIRAHRVLAEHLAGERVRGQHYVVLVGLAAFGRAGAPAQAELCRTLGIDRSDMAGLLDDLQGLGYVARVRCPTDRRRNSVVLTPAGQAALGRLDRLVEAADADAMEPLTREERERLVELLGRVATPRRDGGAGRR